MQTDDFPIMHSSVLLSTNNIITEFIVRIVYFVSIMMVLWKGVKINAAVLRSSGNQVCAQV
jgi:hypothetical protein